MITRFNVGDYLFNEFFGNTSTTFSSLDPEKYEVKIKPNWKKKMLKQEIETIETKIGHYNSQIKHLLSIESELKTQKKELEKQLKDLNIPSD